MSKKSKLDFWDVFWHVCSKRWGKNREFEAYFKNVNPDRRCEIFVYMHSYPNLILLVLYMEIYPSIPSHSFIHSSPIHPIMQLSHPSILSIHSSIHPIHPSINPSNLSIYLIKREQRFSTGLLHKEASLASWEVRARIALMRLMFDYKFCDEYLQVSQEGSTMRSHNGPIFLVDKPKTGRFSRSCPYISRREWNGLPAYLRCINDYKKFKKDIKRLYSYHYFSSEIQEA